MMPYPLIGNRALRLVASIDTTDLTPVDLRMLEQHAGAPQGRILREFLVPERMRLHNLHYALQKAFGWHNTKMHSFSMPPGDFDRITRRMFADWSLLVGIYFRFPDAPPDSYYHGDIHPNDNDYLAWMRRRYCGPYDWDIGAFFEHLVAAKLLLQPYLVDETDGEEPEEEEMELIDTQVFREDVPAIRKLTAQIDDIRELSVFDAQQLFHGDMNVLLERIPLGEILVPHEEEKGDERAINRLIGNGEVAFALGQHYTYPITVELAEQAYQYHDNRAPLDVLEIQDRYERALTQTDIPVQPAATQVHYVHDPGHNWTLTIQCTERYEMRKYRPGQYLLEDLPIYDSAGREVDPAVYAMAHHVITNNRPVVLRAEGTNIPEDTSGLVEFLHFLRRYTGADIRTQAEAIAWARGRGWSPEVPDPRSIL